VSTEQQGIAGTRLIERERNSSSMKSNANDPCG
jgi:hypothetical protein